MKVQMPYVYPIEFEAEELTALRNALDVLRTIKHELENANCDTLIHETTETTIDLYDIQTVRQILSNFVYDTPTAMQ